MVDFSAKIGQAQDRVRFLNDSRQDSRVKSFESNKSRNEATMDTLRTLPRWWWSMLRCRAKVEEFENE